MIPKTVKIKNSRLPDSPGVYLMKDAKGALLYIGKAGNLKRRVESYWGKSHEARIERLVREIRRIDWQKTGSALEALILESQLIKKHHPPYNIQEKDDKSFLYVSITREQFPRVLLVRGHHIRENSNRYFGPFASASQLREALRILRRIFPYSTHALQKLSRFDLDNLKGCFEYEIGLCPGTCIGAITRKEYRRTIRNLILVFEGKMKRLLTELRREMKTAARTLEFEKAEKLKRQIFALQHIRDSALLADSTSDDSLFTSHDSRIEGYDVSNISGTSAVGSMVVFQNARPDKDDYRKFKIRTIRQSDDVGMLKEVLRRRLAHLHEWRMPDVILVDGGTPQVNAARAVLRESGLALPVVGIAKGPTRKKNEFIGTIPDGVSKNTLIRVRDEAHRFAIAYHRALRTKKMVE